MGHRDGGYPKGDKTERAVGIPLGSEDCGMDMPDTTARLEPPRMATNKSRGGPWGWDVTPQGKRGRVDAASGQTG